MQDNQERAQRENRTLDLLITSELRYRLCHLGGRMEYRAPAVVEYGSFAAEPLTIGWCLASYMIC